MKIAAIGRICSGNCSALAAAVLALLWAPTLPAAPAFPSVEACSPDRPLAECAAICADLGAPEERYLIDAVLDCRFDLRRRDWLAAHAVAHDFSVFAEELGGIAGDKGVAFLKRRNAARDHLIQLGSEGNAAAYFYAGMIWMYETISEDRPAVRRAAVLRHAEAFARGVKLGSLSVLDMMTGFFWARDIWGKELAPDLRACWGAAWGAMTAARLHLQATAPDDPHFRAGLVCIEPTLAALQAGTPAP